MPNKKYNWSEFTLSVAIEAPVEKIYKMWTDSEKLCKWLPSDAKMNMEEGGNYEWSWTRGFKEKGKILSFKKPSRLSFTFADSICDVSIKRNKHGSLVKLHQYNIPETEKHKSDTHLRCNNNWTFYLINLKTYLEFGIDLREKDTDYLMKKAAFN